MNDQTLHRKQEKAARYASEPERFHIRAIAIQVKSDHGTRTVTLDGKRISCDCIFFEQNDTCSHIIATQTILKPYFPSDTKPYKGTHHE